MGTNLFNNRMYKQVTFVQRLNGIWSERQCALCDKKHQVNFIEYKNKIGDSEKAISKLNKIAQGHDNFVQMAAETSAGKSWVISHIFKQNDRENAYEGFTGKKIIKVLCVPNHDQAVQVGRDYGLTTIVAGNEITHCNLNESHGFVVVYDKIIELLDLMKIPHFEDDYTILLCLDEAHNIVQSIDFRSKCVKDILTTTQKVRELHGNVIYMTASFETLALFDFTETICFYSENKKENKEDNKIQIIVKNDGVDNNSFYAREIAKVLKDGGIPYVRLQNKTLPQQIVQEIERITKKTYTWTKINSDERDSEDIKNIIETSTLPKKDIIFVTSMIDAGTNITSVDGKQIDNLVPIFIMDDRNTNIDNIEQSFNRIRWSLPCKKILIATNYECEKQELIDIFEEEWETLKQEKDAFNSLYEVYKRREPDNAKNLILGQLNFLMHDGSSSSSSLFLDEENDIITYNPILFFKHCREKLYMKQFLNPCLLKEKLETIFDSSIEFATPSGDFNDINIEKENEDIRMLFFKELSKDLKRIKAFDEKKGNDYEKYKDSEIMKDFTIMRRKIQLQQVIQNLATMKSKELKIIAREICRNELNDLSKNDRRALVDKLNNIEIKYDYDTVKVKDILDGEYERELRVLVGMMSIDKAISLINKYAKPNDLRKEILYHQSKIVNSQFMQQFPAAGKFAREQYAFIRSIESLRDGASLSLSKDNFAMELLIEKMEKEMKKKYSSNTLLEMASRVYKYRELEKGYLLYDLRV